jgi:hypothetical protein
LAKGWGKPIPDRLGLRLLEVMSFKSKYPIVGKLQEEERLVFCTTPQLTCSLN